MKEMYEAMKRLAFMPNPKGDMTANSRKLEARFAQDKVFIEARGIDMYLRDLHLSDPTLLVKDDLVRAYRGDMKAMKRIEV